MNKPLETDLIVVEQINPIELYTGGKVDPLLEEITRKAKDFTADVTTTTGRKEIASMAFKVARSKTTLDELGKNLVADWKQKAKVVDDTRKRIREYLDSLKDEVRKPLTEWEEEQARIEEARKKQEELEAAWAAAILENDLFNQKRDIERREAELRRKEEEQRQREETERRAKAEAERKIREEQEQKEREERIAKEAEERAKKEAEERVRKAEEEAHRREVEARMAAEKAERDRIAAEERAAREKQEAIDAERRRAAEEAEMREKARLGAEAREQERIEAEKREAERIAANKEHQASVNRKAAADLVNHIGLTESQARAVICAIVKGKIDRVVIRY
jgi:colicin import membrane protein